jgi:hypothetical protein
MGKLAGGFEGSLTREIADPVMDGFVPWYSADSF